MSLATTIQNPTHRRILADEIIRVVKDELRAHGVYVASDDQFDLDDCDRILLVDGMGGCDYLMNTPSAHRHSAMIATAIYLRDTDGDA